MDRLDVLPAFLYDLPCVFGKILIRLLFRLRLHSQFFALPADLFVLIVDLLCQHERRFLLIQPGMGKDVFLHQLLDICQDLIFRPSRLAGQLGDINVLCGPDHSAVFIVAFRQIFIFFAGDKQVSAGSDDERRSKDSENSAAGDPDRDQVRNIAEQHRNTDHQSEHAADDLPKA